MKITNKRLIGFFASLLGFASMAMAAAINIPNLPRGTRPCHCTTVKTELDPGVPVLNTSTSSDIYIDANHTCSELNYTTDWGKDGAGGAEKAKRTCSQTN